MVPESLLHGEADELLHKAADELRQHLETGQDCHAETVLSAFPSLASDPNRALELIVLEFQLRRELGQNPQPSEWYLRFPQRCAQLRERLEGTPPAALDSAEQETAAIRTASYSDVNQQTAVEVELEAPILGRHEVLEEIDRGGMGVVYRARDLTLDRVVALKVIRSGTLASEEEVRRFYREARAAAQLRHPHIVPIYGMGLYERQHCFTMALFPRGSVSRYMAEYRSDVHAAVALLVKVARAVQAAHECGIVHRDLKPSNILLDERSEPVVGDFGLAKRMDASATLTLPAHPVGTPAYMAPEQARCQGATAASDIWSLGIILYELLTGSRPFPGNGVDEVKRQILDAEVVAPHRLRADLPHDLERIVLKCLEKEPQRRYPSAAALADDLERWQRGEPIEARPKSRWPRLSRHSGRKAALLLLIGLMLLGAGASAFWGIFSYFSPEVRERRALEAMQRDLTAGKPVTLIGETGPPKWYRERIDNLRPSLPTRPDQLFVVSDAGITLLELLPDPKQQHYRFSAEVRRTNNLLINPESLGRFGIFFHADEQASPAGTEQRCCVFRYGAVGIPEFMQIFCRSRLTPDFRDGWSKTCDWGLLTQEMAPPLSEGWHRLTVEVDADRFAAFFDNSRLGVFDLWGESALQQRRIWWTNDLGAAPPPPPTFARQGALGLYVEGDSAEFRNVVVEPLSDN